MPSGQAFMALDTINQKLWVTFYLDSGIGYFNTSSGAPVWGNQIEVLDAANKRVIPIGIACDNGENVYVTSYRNDVSVIINPIVSKYRAKTAGGVNIGTLDPAFPVEITRPDGYINGSLGGLVHVEGSLWIAINDPQNAAQLPPGQYNTYYLAKCDASDGTIEGYVKVGYNPVNVIFDDPYIWVANSADNKVMRINKNAVFIDDPDGNRYYTVPPGDTFLLMDNTYPQRQPLTGVSFITSDGNGGVWASIGGGDKADGAADIDDADNPDNITIKNNLAHITPGNVPPVKVFVLPNGRNSPEDIRPSGLAIDNSGAFYLNNIRGSQMIEIRQNGLNLFSRQEGKRPFDMVYDDINKCFYISDLITRNNQVVLHYSTPWNSMSFDLTDV